MDDKARQLADQVVDLHIDALAEAAQAYAHCQCAACEIGNFRTECGVFQALEQAKEALRDTIQQRIKVEVDFLTTVSPGSAQAGKLRRSQMHPDCTNPALFRVGWYAGFDACKKLIKERKG